MVAVAFLLAGCVELDTGLPLPQTLGIEKDCTAAVTCHGERLRWETAVCAPVSEFTAGTVGEACDAWAWEHCPEAIGRPEPCEVECLPSAKTCPLYDVGEEMEWPPVERFAR